MTEESPNGPTVSRQIIEVISWKLAAEFHRRHPSKAVIFEGHPGGGQYDCLGLYSGGEVTAYLNRVGGFTALLRDHQIEWRHLWPKCLTESGLGQVLDEMSRGCGFAIPDKVPPSAPNTLSYRVMALTISALTFELGAWEWRNGFDDTAGHPDQGLRDGWFDQLGMGDEYRSATDEGEQGLRGRYKYWFLLKSDSPVCCIRADTCSAFFLEGEPLDLAGTYARRRSVPQLSGMILSRI